MNKRARRNTDFDSDSEPAQEDDFDYVPEPEPEVKPKLNSDSKNQKEMAKMEEIQAQLEQLTTKLKVSENRQKESEEKIKGLTENLNRFQSIDTPILHKDIITEISKGDDIILDSYKVIPTFNGDQKEYRSWREQVVRRMELIDAFKTHAKYEAALGIIRAKIVGAASDILINNNTPYNIEAIVDRLDFSYADQRPLYVVEAEMTSIRQGNKTLQNYYDVVNQALNMVITKIVMTYKLTDEQKSLKEEIQQKAVRTFIIGLKSTMTRNILYGQSPKTLASAFAIAQTVYYDNQYLQLDSQKAQPINQQQNYSSNKYNPNFYYGNKKPQQSHEVKNNARAEPMDVDSSNRFKQSTNWRQPDFQANGQKREYDSSRQHLQQPQKMQRLNQMQDDELQSTDVNCEKTEYIPDDLISNASDISRESATASTFLDE